MAPARAAVVTLALSTAAVLSGGHGPAVALPPPTVDQHAGSAQQGASEELLLPTQSTQGTASANDPWAPGQGTAGAAGSSLEAPSELRAEATSPTTARLTWRPVSGLGEVGGYKVFQQGTSTPVAEVGADTLTTEVGSLEAGISYTFAVQAVGADGRASGASSQVELTMPERPDDERPDRPSSAR